MVTLMFNLLGNLPVCLPKWLHYFTFPPAMCKTYSFSMSLLIFLFFYYSHSVGCKMVFHMILICISLMTSDVEHIFKCLLTIVYFLLYIQIIYLFLFLLSLRAVYILDTSYFQIFAKNFPIFGLSFTITWWYPLKHKSCKLYYSIN